MQLAELRFEGERLESAKVRRLYPDYEADFEYRFDASGRLTALEGSVEVWGKWIGRKDLLPGEDGSAPAGRMRFYGTETDEERPEPERAGNYAGALERYPVYRKTEELPCGGELKEAVRMNAASK